MNNPQPLAADDDAFIRHAIGAMYDEEVARHPEGIHIDEVREILRPRVRELLMSVRGGTTS